MGDFLNHVGHEFTLGNVDSGAPVSIQSKTPDSTGPNGEFVPGQPMTVTHQLQRPTFLSAFLSNLPSAIPLGVENSMRPGGGFATGLAGGLEGIQQNKVLQQSLASQQAEANLKNEQAKSLSSQVTLPNGMTVPLSLAKTLYPAMFKGETALAVAKINKKFMSVPNVGLVDTQAEGGPAVIPGTAGGVVINEEHLKDYNLPPEFLGKTMTLQQLSGIERANNSAVTTVQGASGPSLVNKQTSKTTNLGLGSPGVAVQMAKPVPVGDADTGQVTYVPAGQAIKTGAAAPSSINFQASKAVTKDFTSGKSSQNLQAYNTATHHLQMLSSAIDALNNGDIQAFNKIGNAYNVQAGDSAVTNFEAIKNAVAGELSKVFKGGMASDPEISAQNKTLNSNMSPAQLKGAVNSYLGLMQGRLQSLEEGFAKGKKGVPNFGGSSETKSYNGDTYKRSGPNMPWIKQ